LKKKVKKKEKEYKEKIPIVEKKKGTILKNGAVVAGGRERRKGGVLFSRQALEFCRVCEAEKDGRKQAFDGGEGKGDEMDVTTPFFNRKERATRGGLAMFGGGPGRRLLQRGRGGRKRALMNFAKRNTR